MNGFSVQIGGDKLIRQRFVVVYGMSMDHTDVQAVFVAAAERQQHVLDHACHAMHGCMWKRDQ